MFTADGTGGNVCSHVRSRVQSPRFALVIPLGGPSRPRKLTHDYHLKTVPPDPVRNSTERLSTPAAHLPGQYWGQEEGIGTVSEALTHAVAPTAMLVGFLKINSVFSTCSSYLPNSRPVGR